MLKITDKLQYKDMLIQHRNDYEAITSQMEEYLRVLHQYQSLFADRQEQIDMLSDDAITLIRDICEADTVRVSSEDC